MRMPRMHGRPPRLPGSMVMRVLHDSLIGASPRCRRFTIPLTCSWRQARRGHEQHSRNELTRPAAEVGLRLILSVPESFIVPSLKDDFLRLLIPGLLVLLA